MGTEWQTRWACRDSQEVGLEAAILERVRNSSLVERAGAENVTGLNRAPKPDVPQGTVGERPHGGEGSPEGGLERWGVRMLA